MKAPDFTYAPATTLAEAFRLKAAHGADSLWLAGGQSLLAGLAFRLSEPPALIDISNLTELQGVTHADGNVRIGAGTTYTALAASEIIRKHTPLIADAIPHIAHTAIRNRGTIGGSLAYADPSAELPACCVALNATIVIASAKAERRVPARDFFHGVYATALADNELITAIEIPEKNSTERHTLYELTRRSGDYAMAGLAATITNSGSTTTAANLVFFALGDRPMIATHAAAALVGHPLDEADIERAALALPRDLDPPADLNGSSATKLHLAQVVLRRALTQLAHGTTGHTA
jgi:aerobic carbon-monoxide dehydrogenase medium subunit